MGKSFDGPAPSENEQALGDGLLNSLPKEGFSGVIVYTTLKGYPAAASRHREGEQIAQAFLGDATDSLSLINEIEKYNQIVQNIHIFVGEKTRASESEDNDLAWHIIGQKFATIYTLAFDVDKEAKVLPVDWYDRGLNGGDISNPTTPTDQTAPTEGTGDGEPESSLEDGKYDKNENIQTTSEVVAEILDIIYGDCMGKTLIDSINIPITIVTDAGDEKNGYDGNTFTIYYSDGNAQGEQRPYVLIEELVHAYQHSQVGAESFNSYLLNFEIEAKACWFYFEKRQHSNSSFVDEYDRQLGSRIGTLSFELLLNDICPNLDINNETHMKTYDLLLNNLRTIKGYSKYTESVEGRHFKNFKELTKNCTES